MHNLEAFIQKIEHIIFQSLNRNKNVFHNDAKSGRAALKEIKTRNDCCVWVHMVWIEHGTVITLIEKVAGGRKSKTIFIIYCISIRFFILL